MLLLPHRIATFAERVDAPIDLVRMLVAWHDKSGTLVKGTPGRLQFYGPTLGDNWLIGVQADIDRLGPN